MVQLVARPPIHLPSFSKWDPQRKDDIFLYAVDHHNRTDSSMTNREAYRYRLTIIDHPKLTVQRTKPIISRRGTTRSTGNAQRLHDSSSTTSPTNDGVGMSTMSFTYTNAVFLIPAGRESEYIFSSLSGLRSILKSANTARLIAVAFGRNFSTVDAPSSNTNNNMSIEVVQEELRFVIQTIASAIPSDTLAVSLIMKPDASTTFYPFLALNGIGQRNIIDTGITSCSGRYIVEQCAISSDDDANGNEQQQWVRRLYFLDGNPNVIQSEVHVSREKHLNNAALEVASDDSLLSTNEEWIVDKSVTAFDYHKSLTAGLLAFLPIPNQMTSYNGLLIGLGGGSLINLWHYIHGDIDAANNELWNVTAIELDDAMVQIASKSFGLSILHPLLRIRIGDGLDIRTTETAASIMETPNLAESSDITLMEFQNASLDYIVLDVDSKETGAGMSCPPASFVEIKYLQTLHALLHPDRGVLAINVAARDIHLFHKTCQAVKTVFPNIFLSKRYPNQGDSVNANDEAETEPEDLNVVVFAFRSTLFTENFFSEILEMSDRIEQWMLLHKDTNNNLEERALLQSILKECLTDFVPYETAQIMNCSATQDQLTNSTKSSNAGKRRKHRGGNSKKR